MKQSKQIFSEGESPTLRFCWISTFFDILFFNISRTVKKYYFLKEHDGVFQMDRNKLF